MEAWVGPRKHISADSIIYIQIHTLKSVLLVFLAASVFLLPKEEYLVRRSKDWQSLFMRDEMDSILGCNRTKQSRILINSRSFKMAKCNIQMTIVRMKWQNCQIYEQALIYVSQNTYQEHEHLLNQPTYLKLIGYSPIYKMRLYLYQINFNDLLLIIINHDNFYSKALLNIINTIYSTAFCPPQTMSNLYTRKKIENYSYGLNDVIGKGYSSHVYKGRNDESDQNVAVKVIDLKMLKNEINRILLDSEIEVLKELKHLPHILTLHDVFTTKNNTYIITELCDSDLSKAVKKGLAQADACAYMHQILQGYYNFAKKNIIHRDLKPANILMCNGQLKIADFGFAIKVCDASKSNKYNVGSPLYMAPESLRKNQYTLKTDIWSLGIIFYEMLTGETPWKAKNEKELLRKIQSQKIDELLPKLQVSNNSKQFLMKSLKLDKNLRLSLESLMEFSFLSTQNILMQKKLNIDLKSNASTMYNVYAFTPKTDKISNKKLFIERSGENRSTTKEYSQNKFSSFKNDSINQSIQLKSSLHNKYNPIGNHNESVKKQLTYNCKENPEHNNSTNRNVAQVTPQNKYDKRLISKILVSEIHYCRFLYKLLTKIIESSKNGLLQNSRNEVDAITNNYIGIIKHKIENLMSFPQNNYVNASSYEEYKQTSDFQKLIRIGKQYKERYSNELKSYWDHSLCTFSTESTMNLIAHLHKLLQIRGHHQDLTKKYEREIVILDYLITSKQLIEILKNGQNFEKFARKSRIEEIVEGKTADISMELLEKIMRRAKQMVEYTSQIEFTLQQRAVMLLA